MQYVAKTTFFAGVRKVNKGAVIGHDDPVVKGREHLFTAVGEPEQPKRAPHRSKSADKGDDTEE